MLGAWQAWFQDAIRRAVTPGDVLGPDRPRKTRPHQTALRQVARNNFPVNVNPLTARGTGHFSTAGHSSHLLARPLRTGYEYFPDTPIGERCPVPLTLQSSPDVATRRLLHRLAVRSFGVSEQPVAFFEGLSRINAHIRDTTKQLPTAVATSGAIITEDLLFPPNRRRHIAALSATSLICLTGDYAACSSIAPVEVPSEHAHSAG
jgi:hypothetical protein